MEYPGTKKRLGDILVEEGLITNEQLDKALKAQNTLKQKIGEILVDFGYIEEMTIAKVLQKQLKLDIVKLSGMVIESRVTSLVNEQILRKHMLIPFEFHKTSPNLLRVAMADPNDFIAIDDLSIITNLQIEPVIATPSDIAAAIDKYYGNAEAMAVAERYTLEKETQNKEREEQTQVNEDVNQSPIVLLVKSIIEQAVRQRASDIHIEPLERQVRIRYRVDGILYETMKYEINLLSAIIARIKIIGGLDISEKRKPQDGRISITVDRLEYDIRVSILPTVYGENVVLRITSKKNLTKAKIDLGFSEMELKKFDSILSKPHGLILVTGPTGSGKSTTLYTALSELNKEDVNIITVEDPVEANIDGINQVQVNNKVDLTFANALRSILRQDPDIIMIGEIRDNETAEIAIKASITGHIVVSTLHTNSAVSSITRLMDMGVEPFLIADAIVGIIAQRLVRKLCPSCKKVRYATIIEKEFLSLDESAEQVIYEPCGCHSCNNTGYFGRIGVYEIMPVSQTIREIIASKNNAEKIKEAALNEGMNTLKMSAMRYVLEGVTSIQELKKIFMEE
ncbi:MAG: type pilus assembly protein PilB [Anaerocolumna sp.]|nr:type pilus assembly protein PilB [Anaerocolumna sp.]